MSEIGERNDAVKFGQTTGTPGHDHPAYLTPAKVTGADPIIVTGNPDGTITISGGGGGGSDGSDHDHDARYVNVTGDAMTGQLDVRGTLIGRVYQGLFLGVSAGSDAMESVGTLILARADGTDKKVYLIAPEGQPLILRADNAPATDLTIASSGVATLGAPVGVGIKAHLNDTGWRNMNANIANGWTVSGMTLRRQGNLCLLRLATLSPATKTSLVFFYTPTGFVPALSVQGPLATAQAAGALVRQVTSTATLSQLQMATATAGDASFSGTLMWFTDENWPSSLPGLPA